MCVRSNSTRATIPPIGNWCPSLCACVCAYTSTQHLSSGLSHQSQRWNRDWIDTSHFPCVCLASRRCLCMLGKQGSFQKPASHPAMQETLNWCSKGKGIISLLDHWHLRTRTSDINRPSVITSWTSSNCTLPHPTSPKRVYVEYR